MENTRVFSLLIIWFNLSDTMVQLLARKGKRTFHKSNTATAKRVTKSMNDTPDWIHHLERCVDQQSHD
jgi:hypothetical protein